MKNNFNILSAMTCLTIFLNGCATVEPTAGKKFDVESKNQCVKICKQVDLNFDALVVVGGMAGCVCGNKDSKNTSSTGVMGGQVSAMAAAAAHAAQQAQTPHLRK